MKVKADINIPLISLDYIYFLFNCILLILRPHTDLNMKQQYIALILFLLSLFVAHSASAQIKGVVTDSLTNEPLMYITVQYEGKGVGAITNAEGEYTVETRKGWNELSFSAIGYVTKKVTLKPTTKVLNVKLAPADVMLSEVVVKPQKEKSIEKGLAETGISFLIQQIGQQLLCAPISLLPVVIPIINQYQIPDSACILSGCAIFTLHFSLPFPKSRGA